MLADNRLDFISNIEKNSIDMMSHIRKQFIDLDCNLRVMSDISEENSTNGANRCLEIARQNIETALQYTIKALCLMGEIKE